MAVVEIYTKPACPKCEEAKKVLKENNHPFTELVIGKDITREALLTKFPWAKVVPLIFYDRIAISISTLQLILLKEKLDGKCDGCAGTG